MTSTVLRQNFGEGWQTRTKDKIDQKATRYKNYSHFSLPFWLPPGLVPVSSQLTVPLYRCVVDSKSPSKKFPSLDLKKQLSKTPFTGTVLRVSIQSLFRYCLCLSWVGRWGGGGGIYFYWCIASTFLLIHPHCRWHFPRESPKRFWGVII